MKSSVSECSWTELEKHTFKASSITNSCKSQDTTIKLQLLIMFSLIHLYVTWEIVEKYQES